MGATAMTEPIKLYALSKSGIISTDIDGDPNGHNLMVFVDESEATTTRLEGEEIVELLEVRRCGTCAHREVTYDESDNALGDDPWVQCAILSDDEDGEFTKRVTDETGFCHRHREKTE